MGGKKKTKHKTTQKTKNQKTQTQIECSICQRVGNRLGCGERNYLEKTEINKHSTYISGVE